ncbi:hypothetical protein Tco_1156044 [Tanacetum coccineum]
MDRKLVQLNVESNDSPKIRTISLFEEIYTMGKIAKHSSMHLRPQGSKKRDFHNFQIQDIEDMLLLLVQGKVINLNVEERIAFNVSLRMFTRSVVIQRHVEDLQLAVESYQKKLNLTKPDTFKRWYLDDVFLTALNDRLKGNRRESASDFLEPTDSKCRAMIQQLTKG